MRSKVEPDVGSREGIAGARMFSDSGRSIYAYGQLPAFAKQCSVTMFEMNMSQLLLLGKFEYGGGQIFKVVLEC